MKVLGTVDGKVLADVGGGFDARFGSSLLHRLGTLIVVDVALNTKLLEQPNVVGVVGILPSALAGIESNSVDLVVLNSVLEHLDEPIETLIELKRIVRPSTGIVFVNVPTWFGKLGLETSAFRFKLSPSIEIDDHRRYYSAKQLWQSLRDAGFLPSEMRVRRHKFGLNVYGVCKPRS